MAKSLPWKTTYLILKMLPRFQTIGFVLFFKSYHWKLRLIPMKEWSEKACMWNTWTCIFFRTTCGSNILSVFTSCHLRKMWVGETKLLGLAQGLLVSDHTFFPKQKTWTLSQTQLVRFLLGLFGAKDTWTSTCHLCSLLASLAISNG